MGVTPITKLMDAYMRGEDKAVLQNGVSDDGIRIHMDQNGLRFVTILDPQNRLEALVFMQQYEAYKVGAAIDTLPGWQIR